MTLPDVEKQHRFNLHYVSLKLTGISLNIRNKFIKANFTV